MSVFNPIPAPKLIEQIEGGGVDLRPIIIDLAVAGLVKAYARLILTEGVGGRREVRDCRIEPRLWHRIVAEGAIDDVWETGTIRLRGDGEISGRTSVSVIGIRFEEPAIRSALKKHGLIDEPVKKVPPSRGSAPCKAGNDASPDGPDDDNHHEKPKKTPAIDPLWVSVDDAAVMTGLGRTTVYKLINQSDLIARKAGRRTLISVESIRRNLGG